MHFNLSPTEPLLLFCAQNQTLERTQDMIRFLIKNKIKWEEFITKAISLGIASNCYLRLKKTGVLVPNEIEKRLNEIYSQNLIRNMKLWAVLKKILNAFNQAKIDAIPLKGPFLSDDIHRHIGSRTSTDLDILIRKEDFPRAKQELAKIGYYPVKSSYSEEFIMDFFRHRPFFKKDVNSSLNPVVEIHWNFYPQRPKKFDMTPVWKTAIPKKIENTPFLCLSHSYTLIHLAINLRINGYLNFRHFSDLDALITNFKDKIDWEYVIKQSLINKKRIALFYGLYFTRELLDTEIPSHILEPIKPGWFQNKLVSLFVNPQKIISAEKNKNSLFYNDFVNLLTIDSLKDAFKLLFTILFSYSTDITMRYKKSPFHEKSLLSSLLNPFYLIWTVLNRLFDLMKR